MKHFLFITIPLMLILFSVYFLFQDFTKESQNTGTNKTPIASVKTITGDVKRKPQERMFWFGLKQKENIFDNDHIRAADGLASISFPDGSVIEVGRNSLIVIEKAKDKISIDFIKGSLFAKSENSDIVFKSGGMNIDAKNSKIELTSNSKGETSLNVLEGAVNLKSKEKTVKILKNQKGSFSKDKISEITSIPFDLTWPDRNSLYIASQKKTATIDFKWKNLKSLKSFLFEIGYDHNFDKIFKSIKLTANNSNTRLNVPSGKYFWRIKSEKGNALSEIRPLEIVTFAPVTLVSPAENKKIIFQTKTPKVIFRWSGPDYFNKYVFEYSTNKDFSSTIHKLIVEDAKELALNLNNPGKFYWRVTGIFDTTKTKQSSNIQNIIIEQTKTTPPPKLISPKFNESIPITDNNFFINFRWEEIEEIDNYILEISNDKNFSNTLLSKKTSASSYRWNTTKKGSFYWRVSAYDINNNKIDHNTTNKFNIIKPKTLTLLLPKDQANILYLNEKPEITFQWDTIATAKIFELEIARDLHFMNILYKKESSHSSYKIGDFDNDIYFWRIRALDKDEQIIAQSGVRSFSVKIKDLLPAPTLLEPKSNYVLISWTPEDVKIIFNWQPVKNRKRYEILIKSKENANTQIHKNTKDTSFEITKLDPGHYTWAVRTIDMLDRKGTYSAKKTFIINKEAALTAPSKLKIKQRRKLERKKTQ